MNSHDVGRGRGGAAGRALPRQAECTIVSVDTDRLYPPRLSDELHDAAAHVGAGAHQLAVRS